MADKKVKSLSLGGIVDVIGDGAALYDADDRLVQFNADYAAFFAQVSDALKPGVPFREIMGEIGRIWLSERPKEDLDTWLQTRIDLFNNGTKNIEFERSDGRWIGIDYHKIEGGGTFVITTDISQRKQTEAELIKTRNELEQRVAERTAELELEQARLADFATVASDWLWEMDADLRYTFFSDRNREVTGQDSTKFIGKTRADLSKEAPESEKWAQHLADLEAHRPFRDFTYPLKTQDGRNIHLSINGSPVFDDKGGFQGYRGTGTDISERNRLIEGMKRNEMLFNGLFQTTAVGMVLHAPDGQQRLRVNHKFCQMVGHSEAHLLNEPYELLTHPDDRGESMELRSRLKRGEISYYTLEKRYLHKDGHPVWGSALISVIRDDAGNILNYLSIIEDITQRKEDERALVEAKDAAEIANRAKSSFLANMSHELRTPLNSIIGFSSILAEEMLGNHAVAKYREYSQIIQNSGEHLLQLINDILDRSRIEAESVKAHPQLIDIRNTVNSCLSMSEFQAKQANIEINVDIAESLPAIHADTLHMKQILLNLLSNAVKFTPENGRITVSAFVDPRDRVVLRVMDTGIGVAAEDIPKIIEPFGQVTDSMTRNHEGAGLGLSIVNSLVELNNGTMEIENRLGTGTTVSLYFPQGEKEA